MFMNDFPMQYDGKNLGDVIEWCAIKTAFLGAIVFVLTFAYAFILNYVAGQQVCNCLIHSGISGPPAVSATCTRDAF